MPKSKKQATGDSTPEAPVDKKQASAADVYGWEQVQPTPKRRGRPPKAAAPAPEVQAVESTPKRRGRPPEPEVPKAPATKNKSVKPTAKPPVPEQTEPEDLVVFAFRLTQAEREEIHNAVAPSKASRFVRAIALAAARHDMAGIQAAIIENQRTAAA